MIALVLATIVCQQPAAPIEPPADRPTIKKLKWSPWVDLPVTAVMGGGWLVSEFGVKKSLAPGACRWCEPNALDTSFRTLFNPHVGVVGSSTEDTWSDVGWAATAVTALGIDGALAFHDGALREFPVDALIILEATFTAMAINQTAKFLVGRERPFVHQLSPEQKALVPKPDDSNLSFFSGHATFTMSITIAAATLTQLRGYRLAWLVPAVGVPVSLAVGILRIAADKHYFTDVAVGWIVGADVGFAVPFFFHRAQAAQVEVRLVPSPGGAALAGRF